MSILVPRKFTEEETLHVAQIIKDEYPDTWDSIARAEITSEQGGDIPLEVRTAFTLAIDHIRQILFELHLTSNMNDSTQMVLLVRGKVREELGLPV